MTRVAAQLLLLGCAAVLLLGTAQWPLEALAASPPDGEEREAEREAEREGEGEGEESSGSSGLDDSLDVDEPSELTDEGPENADSQGESTDTEMQEEPAEDINELQQQQHPMQQGNDEHQPSAPEEEEHEEVSAPEATVLSVEEEKEEEPADREEEPHVDVDDDAAEESEVHGLQHVDPADSGVESDSSSAPAAAAEAAPSNSETEAADETADAAAAAATTTTAATAAPEERESSTAASSEPSETEEEEKKPDVAAVAAETGEQQQQQQQEQQQEQQQAPQEQLQEQLGANGAVADPRQGRCSAAELESLAAYFSDGSACPAFGCIDAESSNYLELIEKYYKDEYTTEEARAFAGVLGACHCRCPVMQCEVEYVSKNGSPACKEATREFCLQSNEKFSEKCAMVAKKLPKVYDIDLDPQAFGSPCQVCGESTDSVGVEAMAASEGAALSTSPGALVFAASLSGVLASILLL